MDDTAFPLHIVCVFLQRLQVGATTDPPSAMVYPPTRNLGRYQLLYQDPEHSSDVRVCSISRILHFRFGLREIFRDLWRRRYLRLVSIVSIILLVGLFGGMYSGSFLSDPIIRTVEDFAFQTDAKPAYLDTHPQNPVSIRLAILSRVGEFKRRRVLRETMLNGVHPKDVHLDYRFVVGRADGLWTRLRLFFEGVKHDDVLHLEDLKDVADRISEKRYRALKWANTVPHDQYDYAMTTDSDAFCRLGALARRLQHVHPQFKPRSQSILIARMLSNQVYFENTVPDENINDNDEDYHIKGPWYSHPIGFGYLLSSNITRAIFSADPPLPHHVNYPADDVLIGSWLAGFKTMHNPTSVFETVSEKNPPPQHRVRPKPYLPYVVETTLVDDEVGFHDFKNRGGKDARVDWESICIHRMATKEMYFLRTMEEIKSEWNNAN